jgi:PAS domain S-box-containing protein
LNRKIQLAFVFAVLAFLVLGTISYRNIAASEEREQWVFHTHEVVENLQGLLLAMQNVVSSYRGFVVTGEDSLLAAYPFSVLDVERRKTKVRDLTVDNPVQQHHIPALDTLSAQNIQFAEAVIGERRDNGLQSAAQMLDSGTGDRIMSEFQGVVSEMQDEELRLLTQRNAAAKQRTARAKFTVIVATVLGLLITATAVSSVQRENSKRKLAEETVRENEGIYRMLLEEIQHYAIFTLDPKGIVVSWNAGAERIKGYKADEIIGQNFSCFFTPEDIKRGRPEEVLRMTATTGREKDQGLRVRKDGSRFLASVTFTALRDLAGNLRGYSEVSHDLSESKEAGMKYRGLLEAAPDAMVVVNQGGEIVLLNVQAEKQFGYRRDELIGQQVKNIIPEGFAERLLADGTRTTAEALAQQIGMGIELCGRRKNGSDFPIEIMLSPLESAEGTLVTAAIRDISVRKAAEVHLGQMEGRYRGLLEAAPDAMVVVNQGGEIVLLNVQAEKQFGYRRDELIGQQVKNIIPEGFAERLIADGTRTTAEALAQQIGMGIELRGRRKNGSDFPIEIMLSPLDSAEGILVTAAIRDISTRKRSEAHVQELNRSNEELERFAYVASHDLQEPLRMVASYTQLLSSRYKGKLDADADTFISYAADGANRMQHLIKDLLAYSRVATNAKDLLVTSSEEALQRALRNLGGAIEDSAAQVTHDTLPAVMADQGQLVQLFQNLVGNAIKYQEPGVPKIHISAAKTGNNKWMFSVQDNGLGIESQYFEKIFGIFQRLHKREEFTGTGIGLAICKKIVERHGGSISVQSQLGQGSTFRFALNAEGCKS